MWDDFVRDNHEQLTSLADGMWAVSQFMIRNILELSFLMGVCVVIVLAVVVAVKRVRTYRLNKVFANENRRIADEELAAANASFKHLPPT
jgi:hypothetical protein